MLNREIKLLELDMKDELKEFKKSRLMGSLVRARAEFLYYSEKPTEFFF